jgi:hypothetical protein
MAEPRPSREYISSARWKKADSTTFPPVMTGPNSPGPWVATESSNYYYSLNDSAWFAYKDVGNTGYWAPADGESNSWSQIYVGDGQDCIIPSGIDIWQEAAYFWADNGMIFEGSVTGDFAGEECIYLETGPIANDVQSKSWTFSGTCQ